MKFVLSVSVMMAAALPFAARAAEPAKPAPSLGGCVWSNLAPEVRKDFVKAYAKAGPSTAATKVLEGADKQIKAQVVACSGRTDVPPRWSEGAVTGLAIQEGALAALAPAGIDRAKLLAAWEAAPAAARTCTMAFAAKVYAVKTTLACPAEDAPLALLPLLGIPDMKARMKDSAQIFAFYNGLSHALLTEQWIAAMPSPVS